MRWCGGGRPTTVALVRARGSATGEVWRHVASCVAPCEAGVPLLRGGWGVPRGRRVGPIAFFFFFFGVVFSSSCPWHCLASRDIIAWHHRMAGGGGEPLGTQ